MENTKENKGTEHKSVTENKSNKQEKQEEQKQTKTREAWATELGTEKPIVVGMLASLTTDEQERKVQREVFEQELKEFLK